jgi:uncharacterized protein YcbX
MNTLENLQPLAGLTLSEIWIYPIKSLGGIRLEKATLKGKGLQLDRRWMLIDRDGAAMTQRIYSEMARFKPAWQGNKIVIAFKKIHKIISSTELDVSSPSTGEPIKAQVWDDTVTVMEVDAGVSQWFSHHLKTPCKLVAFPEEQPRPVDPQYQVANDHVSLADAFPFLIIGQRSLDDLNQRLAQPVPMDRFRPNFVFTGGEPYAEDGWRDLVIGRIPFVAAKKSARCVLTTINQETAEKGAEPLRTLSQYRKVGSKIYFGHNLIALEQGEVRVGDPVIPG